MRRYQPAVTPPKEDEQKSEGNKEESQKDTPATPAPKEEDKKKKKKGIGYGVDSNPTTKWSSSEYIEQRKAIA